MPQRQRYSATGKPPSLSSSELVCKSLDHDATDILIDKWLEHRNDAYWDWFRGLRERKHVVNGKIKQLLVWNKGEFVPENVFCRTVDTGRLIPLDRTWTTHVYHHRSMMERKLSMMPVVFTMVRCTSQHSNRQLSQASAQLPELMLLRGMHDTDSDDIWIIVTDMKRQEMDDATEYFQLVCRHSFGRACKPSMEQRIQYEHMRLTHTLHRQRRTPCFPQIDLTFRAILHEKRPPFVVLFSHQTSSYSQILFTHPLFVPSEEIFYDFPSGCPNPCCTDDCEMIRFPRRGLDGAAILSIKRGGRNGKRIKEREMCNWIDCEVCFNEDGGHTTESSEGSQSGADNGEVMPVGAKGLTCSKCKLVKYCSADHQKKDFSEHRRLCTRAA